MKGAARTVIGAALAAGLARGAYAALRRYPPAGEKTWARTNHRGETVTLLEGPAVTVGAVTGQVITAAVAARRAARPLAVQRHTERVRPFASPLAMAGLGGAAFGVIDDLRGSAKRRGLRGHLGALAHGEVTTGTVKLAGLAATGLGAALLEGGAPADIVINTGLVAGGANLLNLFDLRPGRAIKVATASAAMIAATGALTSGDAPDGDVSGSDVPGRGLAGRPAGPAPGAAAVAVPVGAALALLPEDLGERAMLGDAGANALGAMLGAAAAQALPRGARLCLLTVIVALTAASEKVSFTKVIAATPPLDWLDMLGRRPAPLGAPVPAAVSSNAVPSNAVPSNAVPSNAVPSNAVPAAPAKTEQLAWWVPRRRPGRHRRTRADS